MKRISSHLFNSTFIQDFNKCVYMSDIYQCFCSLLKTQFHKKYLYHLIFLIDTLSRHNFFQDQFLLPFFISNMVQIVLAFYLKKKLFFKYFFFIYLKNTTIVTKNIPI